MDAMDHLLEISPPPDEVGGSPDWDAVEERLGFRLPSDYKRLVDTYGPGSFGGFLHLLQPAATLEPIRLESQVHRSRELLDAALDGGESIPFDVRDLVPGAATDNGDTVYWVARPLDNPDAWTIAANGARNSKWPTFDGGIVGFLAAVMSGAYQCEVFPRSFPVSNRSFKKYPSRSRRRL